MCVYEIIVLYNVFFKIKNVHILYYFSFQFTTIIIISAWSVIMRIHCQPEKKDMV